MIFYSINILLIILNGIIIKPSRSIKNSNIFLIIIFIQLLIIYTFRSYNIGFDSITYYQVFKEIDSFEWNNILNHWMEFGYMTLNKIIRSFTNNYNILFGIIGTIIMIPLFKIIKKYSQGVLISVLLYLMLGFYYDSMNIVRQMIGVSICMYSFKSIIDEKYIKAIIISIIAMCFHSSAYIFIPFIILSYKIKELDKKSIVVLVALIVVMFIFYDYIIIFAKDFMNIPYLNEGHLAHHVQGGQLNMFIVFFAISVLGLIYRKRYIKLYEDKKRIYDISLLAVIFGTMLQLISINLALIARFTYYFTIYSCILIPSIIKCMGKRDKILMLYPIIILFLIYHHIYLFVSENGYGKAGVVPYQVFWDIN